MRPFFEAVDRGEIEVVTSVLTLTEVLVYPLRDGNHRLAEQYRKILLHARNVRTVSITDRIAESAAELRGQHGLRTPDAIQIATAVHSGATSLLTNDSRFSKVSRLNVLILDQVVASSA